MKKRLVLIICITVLMLCGCTENSVGGTQEMGVDEAVIGVEEGEYDALDKSGIKLDDETIINMNDVATAWEEAPLEDILDEYELEPMWVWCGTLPWEIKEVYASVNDGVLGDNIADYRTAHCKSLDIEALDEEIVMSFKQDSCNIVEVNTIDLNYDGESEYLVKYETTNKHRPKFAIYENVQGEIASIFESTEEYGCYEVLESEDKFYCLSGDKLFYFDKFEKKYITVNTWYNGSVSSLMAYNDYTEYQFYPTVSDVAFDLSEEHSDLVWNDLAEAASYEFIDGYSKTPQVAEVIIEGEKYYYLRADFNEHVRDNRYDSLLFLLKENEDGVFEIIKAYYSRAEIEEVCFRLEEELSGDVDIELVNQKARMAYEEYVNCEEFMLSYAMPTGEPDKRYRTEYVIRDADNDGIINLIIRIPMQWFIFTYDYSKDSVMCCTSLAAGNSYQYYMCEDNTYIYWTVDYVSSSTIVRDYDGLYFRHFYLDEEGEDVTIEWFCVTDTNEDGVFGNGDKFEICYGDEEITECSYEEWKETAEKYIVIPEDGCIIAKELELKDLIEWTVYCDTKR